MTEAPHAAAARQTAETTAAVPPQMTATLPSALKTESPPLAAIRPATGSGNPSVTAVHLRSVSRIRRTVSLRSVTVRRAAGMTAVPHETPRAGLPSAIVPSAMTAPAVVVMTAVRRVMVSGSRLVTVGIGSRSAGMTGVRPVMVSGSRSAGMTGVRPVMVSGSRSAGMTGVRPVMVSGSRSLVIAVRRVMVSVSPLVTVVSGSRSLVIAVRRVMVSVSPLVTVVSGSRFRGMIVRRVTAVPLATATGSRSAGMTVVRPVMVSVSPLVTVVSGSRFRGMIVRSVIAVPLARVTAGRSAGMTAVRPVMVSGSRSRVIAVRRATVSVSPSVTVGIASLFRGMIVRSVTAARPAVTGPLTVPTARRSAGMMPLPRRAPATPRTCAAPTARTASVPRKSTRTSQDRSWTRSPAPSCATSRKSTASGWPSTW